jgi:predicted RecB family nuclease
MQRIDGRLVLSPTDLTKHVACPHITTLDLEALEAGHDRASGVDDSLNLVFTKGLQHEHDFLDQLRSQGLEVVDIAALGLSGADAEAATVAAMRRGVDVVYQATFFDGHWVGLADFLLRVDLPDGERSAFGPWRYDVADTKLARRLKVPALLQMASYAARLEQLQGLPPARLTVVTGDREQHPWRLVDVAPYARRRRDDLLDAIENPSPTESVRVQQCGQCRWKERCAQEWLDRDDLIQVAGMRVDHRARLVAAGIPSLEGLATATVEQVDAALAGSGRATRERLHEQARLQLAERVTGTPQYRLVTPPWIVQRDRDGVEHRLARGLATLPEPDLGDVYLDFEGDPWAQGGAGREYLAGIWTREGEFTAFWAHDFAEEGRLTTELVDWITDRWRRHPGMHVYHYASYETTALKRLVSQHATREHELDQLLRGERFVDLYAVVRQGLRISKASYSIKKLEEFYWGHVRSAQGSAVADGLSSVVEYERWIVSRDAGQPEDAILEDIRRYNEEDVRSTLALHEWLEGLRRELEAGGFELARPVGRPAEEIGDAERAEIDLADRLLASVGATVRATAPEPVVVTPAELLAGCVGWHRREDRPDWWDFFSYADLDNDELVESAGAIGPVGPPVHVGEVKQSVVWRYPFPAQEVTLEVGERAHDVDTHQGVGEVVAIDPVEGWVDLKIGKRNPPTASRGFKAPGPLSNQVMRDSIARTAEAFLEGRSTLGSRLLARTVPPAEVLRPRAGEGPADVVVRVGARLDGAVLAIQGPPGTGKTFAGARLVRALLDQGLRVGVTGLSHNVIRHLLDEVGRPALHRGGGDGADADLVDADGQPRVPLVRPAGNDEVAAALAAGTANLVGGTAWLWSRPELAGSVDVLVIDEAGQFSLANAVAVSQAADSLVLLGDPQQLQQPTKAVHPHSAGVSVLEHLIGEHDVVPDDRGVFLDRTYRMHRDLTAFVSELAYEGRLESAVPDATQDLGRVEVTAPGALSGTGLRWAPVEHEVPVDQASDEEATVVRGLVDDLLQGSWTNAAGVTVPVALDDVLVVAPYNAHVAALRRALPGGARVGTVDRFQGQQGAVVIYSMGSTSAALAPRGVTFLYDLHRLNVAISRARALAVVVGSPLLLDAEVHTPDDLRAVNALCRYVDEAKLV